MLRNYSNNGQEVKFVQVGYYGVVGSPLSDQLEWFGLLPRKKYALINFAWLIGFNLW